MVLLGDTAWGGPTGMGTSLALLAAHVLAGELAARLAAVPPDQVQGAARDLDPGTAAVLELRPTGGAQ